MEEIIASISRIIAEDKTRASDAVRPRPSVAAAPTERSDILELTEAINEDGSVRRMVPAGRSCNRTAA